MTINKVHKTLYFCSSGIFGGAEKFVETCLIEDRESSELFLLNRGSFLDRCLSNKLRLHLCPFKTRLSNIFSWLRFQIYFYSFLKNSDFNIIHFTMPYSVIFGALPARVLGKKIVWFQHGPIGGTLDSLARFFPCDLILFNSHFSKEDHIKKVGKISTPYKIIYPIVHVASDEKVVKKIKDDYAAEDGLLIYAGRICRWKGIEHAINSLAQIKLKLNLIILGVPSTSDDKVYLQELKSLVNDLGLEKKVMFLGFKDNVYDFMKASDILLHTSTTPEPYGLVITEAAALGCFVIANKLGGVSEALEHFTSNYSVYEHTEHNSQLIEAINDFYLRKREEVSAPKIPQVSEMIHEIDKAYKSLL